MTATDQMTMKCHVLYYSRHEDVSKATTFHKKPYPVYGCQEELNNFFNLVRKPSSFNPASFSTCLLSPPLDCSPLLPPPGQILTLQLSTTCVAKIPIFNGFSVVEGGGKKNYLEVRRSSYLCWCLWLHSPSLLHRSHPQQSSLKEISVYLSKSYKRKFI